MGVILLEGVLFHVQLYQNVQDKTKQDHFRSKMTIKDRNSFLFANISGLNLILSANKTHRPEN